MQTIAEDLSSGHILIGIFLKDWSAGETKNLAIAKESNNIAMT